MKWYNIEKDGPPQQHAIVDVFVQAGFRIPDCQWIQDEGWWDTVNARWLEFGAVTHWMPKPPSPHEGVEV